MGRDSVHVSLMQFADDTLLFCKDKKEMLKILFETIKAFQWLSEMKINWEKSSLSGVNIEDQRDEQTAKNLNCKAEKLPILYLGLPLGGNPKNADFLSPVQERIFKKLDRWKRYQISKGSRLTLCNSVLASIPLYYLSLFHLPVMISIGKNPEDFLMGRLLKWLIETFSPVGSFFSSL